MDFKQFYFSPEGRVNRKQFWLWLVLPLYVISFVFSIVDVVTGRFDPEWGIGLFSGLFLLLVLAPFTIVSIKRLHDRNKSGWWVLIAFIPFFGWIWWLIDLGFLEPRPSIPQPNRFGPPITV